MWGREMVIPLAPLTDETHLAHTLQDVRLSLIVSVGTDTEVHLLGIGILLEGLRHTENGVFGSEWLVE